MTIKPDENLTGQSQQFGLAASQDIRPSHLVWAPRRAVPAKWQKFPQLELLAGRTSNQPDNTFAEHHNGNDEDQSLNNHDPSTETGEVILHRFQ